MKIYPEQEPESVSVEAQYAEEFRAGQVGNSAYWVIEAARHAVWALLGEGSRHRPEGVRDRYPAPGQRLVLTVDDWTVTASLEGSS